MISRSRREALQRALLVVNAIGTAAAAFVLAVWPSAIPRVIGITLLTNQFVLAYFLSASEAAICVMCVQALRSAPEMRVIPLQTLVVFHLATAVLSAIAVMGGSSPLILWNLALRVVLALLILISLSSRFLPD